MFNKALSTLFLLFLAFSFTACDGTGQSVTLTPTAPVSAPTVAPTEALREAPDLNGETIALYHIADPADEYVNGLITAVEDMVAAINESGGVFGAELQLELLEAAADAGSTLAAYEELKADGDAAIIIVYDPQQQAHLSALAAEDQIPVFGAQPDAQALYGVEDGFVFTLAPLYAEQFAFFLEYLHNNWNEVRPVQTQDVVRVAYLGWDTPIGQAGLTPELLAFAEDLGIEIVTTQLYPDSPVVNTVTPILDARSAMANVLYVNAYSYGAANLLNDLSNMAIRQEMLVGGAFYAMDALTYAYLSRPENADGLYASFPAAWWSETDNPAIEFALQNLEANGRAVQQKTIARLLMQGSVDVVRHALEQAILEVGFEDLDGQAVYEALIALEGYQVLGGLMAVDFTDGRRSPGMMQVRQIQGGLEDFVILEDFAEAPDLRPLPQE